MRFFSPLRARGGPLFLLVLFAVKNGTHAKAFSVKAERGTLRNYLRDRICIQNKYIVEINIRYCDVKYILKDFWGGWNNWNCKEGAVK